MLEEEDIFIKIRNGILDLPNFEETMKDFEESRQDRPLYGRDEKTDINIAKVKEVSDIERYKY